MQPPGARLLAAADVYHALTEPRPHRPARPSETAAGELLAAVRAGPLDGDAANAVLGAAGHLVGRRRREWPAGLTEREVEVLRLVARGLSDGQTAGRLYVSKSTVHYAELPGCIESVLVVVWIMAWGWRRLFSGELAQATLGRFHIGAQTRLEIFGWGEEHTFAKLLE